MQNWLTKFVKLNHLAIFSLMLVISFVGYSFYKYNPDYKYIPEASAAPLIFPTSTPTPTPAAVGPSISYTPGVASTLNFTGVTTIGSTGSGTIVATPFGGSGGGTTTLDSFGFAGLDASWFSLTSASTLTFTAGVGTPQGITMTCTSGASSRTATLTTTETITGGSVSNRSWTVNCPAGTPPVVDIDCGLRAYDGSTTITFACESGTPTSAFQINDGTTTYGVILVDPSDPDASPFRIETSGGTKALKSF